MKKKWQEAIVYCENLKLGGYDDWKLPNKDTLKALFPKKDNLNEASRFKMKITGVAWLSSVRVVKCWINFLNERNPSIHSQFFF